MSREKNRQENQPESRHVIYGVMPVLEALRAGARRIDRILIAEGKPHQRIGEIRSLARSSDIACREVPRGVIEKTAGAGANHQGVLAFAASAEYAEADSVIRDLSVKDSCLCLLLDGIEDPHNLGAILRTAECAGVDAVFLPERRSAGLNETVAKTSAGAADLVTVARVTNLNRLIDELKEAGFWIAGADGEAEQNYSRQDWTGKWALVLGSEGAGISRLTREKCDVLVKIPVYGRIDSLNVSVAAGILLFEAVRQRKN